MAVGNRVVVVFLRKLGEFADYSKFRPGFVDASYATDAGRHLSLRRGREIIIGNTDLNNKVSLAPGLTLCNLVTDYRTFIEDFQRLVRFVDYLNVLKL